MLPNFSGTFTTGLYLYPLFPIVLLREVLVLCGCEIDKEDALAGMEISEEEKTNTNLLALLWLGALYDAITSQMIGIKVYFYSIREPPTDRKSVV